MSASAKARAMARATAAAGGEGGNGARAAVAAASTGAGAVSAAGASGSFDAMRVLSLEEKTKDQFGLAKSFALSSASMNSDGSSPKKGAGKDIEGKSNEIFSSKFSSSSFEGKTGDTDFEMARFGNALGTVKGGDSNSDYSTSFDKSSNKDMMSFDRSSRQKSFRSTSDADRMSFDTRQEDL